jgi:hypothetical protein
MKARLSHAQREALRRRQLALFMPPAVFGHGSTLAALRRRGIVVGRQPHAELTPFGERVVRFLDHLSRPERTGCEK